MLHQAGRRQRANVAAPRARNLVAQDEIQVRRRVREPHGTSLTLAVPDIEKRVSTEAAAAETATGDVLRQVEHIC